MIDALGDDPIQVLFGIAIRILENAVVHSHWKCGDVTGRSRYFDATVQRCDVRRLKASTTRASDIDALRIHIGPAYQVIDSANAVPDFPARQIGAGEIR